MVTCKDRMVVNIPIFKKNDSLKKILFDIKKNIHIYDTIEYVYVINNKTQLLGVASLKEIMRKKGTLKISQIMNSELLYVRPEDKQEKAVAIAINNQIKTIPIIDKDKKMLGIIKTHTLLKILHEEHTEDILKIAGIQKTTTEVTSLRNKIKTRSPWIIFGLFWGILAAMIISMFENILETLLILAMYFPVMMNVSGSVGNQASIIYIKNDALNKIQNTFIYFLNEIKIGLAMAFICSIILAIFTWIMHGDIMLSIIISSSLFFAALLGLITGVSIPIMLKRFGKDPANGSGPLITALLDLLSLGVYLIIATFLLSLI